jgi:hypothetical protein
MSKPKPNPKGKTLLDVALEQHKHSTGDAGSDGRQSAQNARAIKHFAAKPESRLK